MPTSSSTSLPVASLSWWDNLTALFLGSQVLIAVLVDLAPLYPRNALTAIPHAIGDYYVRTYNDPLARGLSSPGGWYHSFVWLEIGLQVPLSLWLASRYRRGRQHSAGTLVGLLIYGVQVATNTFACLYELFSFSDSVVSLSQKRTLAMLFAPYVILPAAFAFTAVRRLVCGAREKDRRTRRLARLAKAGTRQLTFVVTGANSGIGFGILEQLIDQLDVPLREGVVSLKLIPTVRSKAKASEVLNRLSQRMLRYGRALDLYFVYLDLCDMASIKRGCLELAAKGPIDGLICNAGMADFDHLSLKVALRQALSQGPMPVLTVPEYIIQKPGVHTGDGMSKTFQANFFGHYIMAELLRNSCKGVVWMTSLEAAHNRLDPADLQAMAHRFGYQSSKQLINVMYAHGLAQRPFSAAQDSTGTSARSRAPTRLVHPGFCATNIVAAILPAVFLPAWEAMFHVLSACGYRHHVATAYNGAFAAAEAALDLACPLFSDTTTTTPTSTAAARGDGDEGKAASGQRVRTLKEAQAEAEEERLERHSFGSAITPLGWSYSYDEGPIDTGLTDDQMRGVVAEVEALRDVWLAKLSGV